VLFLGFDFLQLYVIFSRTNAIVETHCNIELCIGITAERTSLEPNEYSLAVLLNPRAPIIVDVTNTIHCPAASSRYFKAAA